MSGPEGRFLPVRSGPTKKTADLPILESPGLVLRPLVLSGDRDCEDPLEQADKCGPEESLEQSRGQLATVQPDGCRNATGVAVQPL